MATQSKKRRHVRPSARPTAAAAGTTVTVVRGARARFVESRPRKKRARSAPPPAAPPSALGRRRGKRPRPPAVPLAQLGGEHGLDYSAIAAPAARENQRPGSWQGPFLREFAKHGTTAHAARVAGVALSVVYHALHTDVGFKALYDLAYQASGEELEREAYRRAMSSSDNLMNTMLRARKPLQFREKVEHLNVDVSGWTDAQLDAYTAGTPLREVLLMAPRDVTPRETNGVDAPGTRQDAPGDAIVVEARPTAAPAAPAALSANTAAAEPAV